VNSPLQSHMRSIKAKNNFCARVILSLRRMRLFLGSASNRKPRKPFSNGSKIGHSQACKFRQPSSLMHQLIQNAIKISGVVHGCFPSIHMLQCSHLACVTHGGKSRERHLHAIVLASSCTRPGFMQEMLILIQSNKARAYSPHGSAQKCDETNR
jgi:hypothetical protein